MDDKELVGFALRLLRENSGLSQEQMANKVRRTPAAVYRHEAGKKAPALDEISAYLRATGCRLSEFEALVEALGRFRGRIEAGPAWWADQAVRTAQEEAQRVEYGRLADDLGAAARRFAHEFLEATQRSRRL